MRIAMIGTGYVGLVSGACFSEFGAQVICVDTDAGKIARLVRGEIPIFEPGLDHLVATNAAAGRLSFTTDLDTALDGADAVFIAVGTPSRRGDGHADLSYVFTAADDIGRALTGKGQRTVVVTKSTVPVGTGRRVANILAERLPAGSFDVASNPEFLREGSAIEDFMRPLAERLPAGSFDVASNPEFLREGSAIEDFMRPDRVVIGTDSEHARTVMRALYRPLYLIETPIVFTTIETAEMIKYAANAFLATKVTFINEVADLCEAVGADVQDVARGIGLDGRIGRKFLHAGPGFGGSCFPKDCRALVRTAEEAAAPLSIVETVLRVNDARKRAMADRIAAACGGTLAGKTLAVLGLTFKPNTDDMRDSPSLSILPALLEGGAKICAYDPEGIDESRKLMPELDYCDDAYQAMVEADALVLLTEWNEFRGLDLARVRGLLRSPVVIDLRNIYQPQEMATAGFTYHSIGRPVAEPFTGHAPHLRAIG
jgi:UDPglucose 6-dehydrogenase